jgi:hypothetical protein
VHSLPPVNSQKKYSLPSPYLRSRRDFDGTHAGLREVYGEEKEGMCMEHGPYVGMKFMCAYVLNAAMRTIFLVRFMYDGNVATGGASLGPNWAMARPGFWKKKH